MSVQVHLVEVQDRGDAGILALEDRGPLVVSEVQGAELKVEFALTAQEKYVKGEAREERRDREILITNTLENLQIAEERLRWSEELFAKGFETKSNLDTDRLKVSQTKSALEQARQRLWLLETFDEPKRRRGLEAGLDEAKQNLERVKLQGERRLAQYQADVETQKNTLELSRRKLERDRRQLEACRILAPQDGLVVYPSSGNRWSSESMIEEGAVVRNRQELIRLPDVTAMKLEVKIHEAHINQVRTGQPAYVVLDAMPDRRFAGVVNKVGLVPDTQSRWGNPKLKVYATEILITDTVTGTDSDASDTKTYSLTDTAGGRFTINASTGVITVADGSLLNYEASTSHSITVRVTDSGGLTYDKTFSIGVSNVNEAPTNITLTGNTVAENTATGTVVGTAAGSDADAGDTKTYSLTDTAGGRFAINASTGQLTVADGSLLNYEADARHSVTVRMTDAGGLTFDQTFSIGVSDVNEAPKLLAISG